MSVPPMRSLTISVSVENSERLLELLVGGGPGGFSAVSVLGTTTSGVVSVSLVCVMYLSTASRREV